MSDNGWCFTSTEFPNFMPANDIHHIKVAPHHPSSNYLAEKAVSIVKLALIATSKEYSTIDLQVRVLCNSVNHNRGNPSKAVNELTTHDTIRQYLWLNLCTNWKLKWSKGHKSKIIWPMSHPLQYNMNYSDARRKGYILMF